jgi:flagellar basal body P-ring formation protein FlgA
MYRRLFVPLFCINFIVICIAFCSSAYAASLEYTVKELIIEKLGGNVSDLDLQFDSQHKLHEIKLHGDKIQNIQLIHFAPNYSTFRVSIMCAEDNTIEVGGRYVAYAELPVAVRAIRSTSIITNADLSTARTPVSRANGCVSSMEDVIGMQAKRNIASGVLIKYNDLVKPTLIRQNDAVSIIYSKDNIKLRTTGVAMESGAIGDSIKVKNESTGIMVHGNIKGKNLVEVGEEL